MKPDDFEEQLRQQPLRPAPSKWRAEILNAARQAARPQRAGAKPQAQPQAVPWWREWLWPSPEAWAGLAAVWLILLGVHLSAAPGTESPMARRTAPTPEAQIALAAQRREMSRLLDGPAESAPAATPSVPGPRSERTAPIKA